MTIDLARVERTIRMVMDSTPEHRARALEVTAAAIPYLEDEGGFCITDFFLTSAFTVGFIAKGEIPTADQINDLASFLNGVKSGDTQAN